LSTTVEIARLAAAVNLLRPEWPQKSLQTLLERDHADRPFQDLAVALVAVAVDPASHTPRRLSEPGPWWQLARLEPTPTPPPIGAVLDEEEPTSAPDVVKSYASAIRADLVERSRGRRSSGAPEQQASPVPAPSEPAAAAEDASGAATPATAAPSADEHAKTRQRPLQHHREEITT
jgi:hypothetical protein